MWRGDKILLDEPLRGTPPGGPPSARPPHLLTVPKLVGSRLEAAICCWQVNLNSGCGPFLFQIEIWSVLNGLPWLEGYKCSKKKSWSHASLSFKPSLRSLFWGSDTSPLIHRVNCVQEERINTKNKHKPTKRKSYI